MSDLLALDTAGWYLLVMIKLFFFLTYIRVISAVSVGVWCQSSRIPCEQSIEVNTVVTTLTHLISNQIEETLTIKIKSCFLLTEHDYSHINTFNIWHIKSRTIPMFEFHFDQSNILRHYLYFCFSFVYFLHKWSKIRSRWSVSVAEWFQPRGCIYQRFDLCCVSPSSSVSLSHISHFLSESSSFYLLFSSVKHKYDPKGNDSLGLRDQGAQQRLLLAVCTLSRQRTWKRSIPDNQSIAAMLSMTGHVTPQGHHENYRVTTWPGESEEEEEEKLRNAVCTAAIQSAELICKKKTKKNSNVLLLCFCIIDTESHFNKEVLFGNLKPSYHFLSQSSTQGKQ